MHINLIEFNLIYLIYVMRISSYKKYILVNNDSFSISIRK